MVLIVMAQPGCYGHGKCWQMPGSPQHGVSVAEAKYAWQSLNQSGCRYSTYQQKLQDDQLIVRFA
jgi:hypothetical protein